MGFLDSLFNIGKYSKRSNWAGVHSDTLTFLEDLIDEHTPLDVRIETSTRISTIRYRTIAIKIDSGADGSLIILDELMPRDGTNSLTPGTKLIVETPTTGMKSQFACIVQHESNGMIYCQLPKSILHEQKRKSQRYDVYLSDKAELRFISHSRVPVTSIVKNLSDTGAQILIKTTPPIFPPLSKGDRYGDCQLFIKKNKGIELSMEIVNLSLSKNRLYFLVGTKFTDFRDSDHRKRFKSVLKLLRDKR